MPRLYGIAFFQFFPYYKTTVCLSKVWRAISMLELYHDSNAIIDEIDLSRSKRGKVFGVWLLFGS